MQATMARQHPRDTGLPLGSLEPSQPFNYPAISGQSSASTIMSPLSLPHGVSGYFDYPVSNRINRDGSPAVSSAHRIPRSTGSSYLNTSHPAVYSPLSPGARGPAVQPPSQFLSPNLHPITQGLQYNVQQHQQQHPQQQRSASMSPTRRFSNKATTLVRSRSTASRPTAGVVSISPPSINGMPPSFPPEYMSNGAIPPTSAASAGHPRSVSEGAAGGNSSHVQMIRRLIQQNGRIREAWEAERKYMEANRERVEEVYKEERALMEEERSEWEYEKEALLKKIELLQQQVAGLCGYRGPKNDVSAKTKPRYGNADWNLSPDSMRSSASSQGSALPAQRNGGLPTGGDLLQRASSQQLQSISDAPHHPSNFGTNPTSRLSPSMQPESSPFIPMALNNNGMASPPAEDASPVPIVDVQEIIPTSEGIPIKASAVQRTTFSDGPHSPPASKPSSRTPSPPADPSKLGVPGKTVKEETLQVLAADEVDRLTMHAGHTPNHSLSVLPTVTATTASSSGESTPTLQPGDMTDSNATASAAEPTDPPNTRKSETRDGHSDYPEEAVLDAGPEDAPLKGPLMVRNMPAHDEIFFKQLSDKLEEVSKGSDASVPAVLRDVLDEEESTETKPANGPDNAAAETASSDKSSPRSREEQEVDIPLKLKRNNNFGAPFGEFR
ncbi:hypothetical protein GE09DRAFT_196678 [Coniochaeta sp. 2T2.1]|nr:hypothetical protein GE09DRAFT_196678 [Coniochaeta sp. 2T2.1]